MERTELVKVRCTFEEKRRFEELARQLGLTVSDLIRRRVFEHVDEEPVHEALALDGSAFDDSSRW